MEEELELKQEMEYETLSSKLQIQNNFENPTYVKEFVKKYAELPQLWNPQHEDYTNKRVRRAAYIELLHILRKSITNATIHTVPQKINSIRSNYRKELRKYLQSRAIGPNGEEVYTYKPSWRFREMYKFLGTKLFRDESFHEPDINSSISIENATDIAEVTVQETSYIEDDQDATQEDVKTFYYNEKPIIHEYVTTSKKKQNYKRRYEYCDENGYTNTEFEVIGKNVSLKLRRMNPEQRCHAELLINKVLINGLKNNLSDETDLTDLQVLDKQLFQECDSE